MDIVQQALGDIAGGRVLDVATGDGRFALTLASSLKDFEEIIGVDLRDAPSPQAEEVFRRHRLQYRKMDASHLGFPDSSFDTVAIGQSLHHLGDLEGSFEEMLRVLRPGGRLIVSEMYRDGLNEPQMTHVMMHDWMSEIDTALEITHNPTFTRNGLLELLNSLGMARPGIYDYADLHSSPKDPVRLAELEGVIEAYLAKSEALEEAEFLAERGREICRRLHDVGYLSAARILFLGQKELREDERDEHQSPTLEDTGPGV